MAAVELRQVRKTFGGAEIINGIDLCIHHGELTVFVGPSGCGKSTLLRLIAGLEELSSGEVLIDNLLVNDIPPAKRGLALVFQSYALYPHMNVAENMSFSLKLAGVPKAERQKKVREAASVLNLEDLLDRKPKELSGGQRQRVAIGRAIVRNPKVFLFDEPLSNLDAALRVRMRLELTTLHRQLGATMIYVTHDQVEAMTMADRIVVLRAGAVEQVGSPMELYRHPRNLFVAGFIGSPRMNLMRAEVSQADAFGCKVVLGDGVQLSLPLREGCVSCGEKVTVGIRPEHIILGSPDENTFHAEINLIEHLGGESYVYLSTGAREPIVARVNVETELALAQRVQVKFAIDSMHVFNVHGESLRAEPALKRR